VIDVVKLNDIIDKKGIKKGHLAKRCHMSGQHFSNCLNPEHPSEFKVSHAQTLCEELGITDPRERSAIFFADAGA
jgi:hypothetical protein